jgi:ABC-2 type transport system ATP-binding protein
VLISSHLLSEVAQTADELVMIRGGKLVAQTTLAEFTSGGGSQIRVRAAKLDALESELVGQGATIGRDGAEALLVSGLTGEQIGELALVRGIAIHELATQQRSLEERFFELMGEEEAGS